MQVMSPAGTMQTAGHDHPMVSAASYSPLRKAQERTYSVDGVGKSQSPGRPS